MNRMIDRADAWLGEHDVAGPLVLAVWSVACSIGGPLFGLWLSYRLGLF